ncbi:hypothetical protein TWF569_005551 [Orbilia oligospora]|uniref:Uncharacterized protein n=1 Tax=Orbilia oligospora TaxID=2813651 RepID=A0A7C8PCK9_ORBOL|nr:hypothetical protein TWF102_011437 [Orbilia oligospora]KAF3115761.1 hypothetical protein TWF706_005864 [Orbilia oligospora]KAF3118023.1 hypothetical protein TWF103_000060 [Orbilia oligospora]KAF3141475.1 hypothetical protein TWF594_006030 [Orbilia oligospora]KAF3144151.1 hypothetical protein TWF703_009446 [Orbilia oligospora]
MPNEVIKTEQLDAERSLAVIRTELEKLHRLSPHNLPRSRLVAIVSQLPTAQDILAPAPASTATAQAFATLGLLKRVLISTIFRLWWIIIYGLALIGGTTVGLGLFVYLLTKLPWQTSFTADGQGWQRHSDGYYYWGQPQDSYTRTAEATVRTEIPEIEARDL